MCNVMPNRIKILSGESIYSYLVRFASANGMTFQMLKKIIWIKKSANMTLDECKHIDLVPWQTIDIANLINLTGVRKEDFSKTSLDNIYYTFKIDDGRLQSQLLHQLIDQTLSYCPECLKECPYYRLIWRFSNINGCLIHKKLLLNKCLECNKPIRFGDSFDIATCPYCGSNLTFSKNKGNVISEEKCNEIQWYNNTLNTLIGYRDKRYTSSHFALNLLYILDGSENMQNRDIVNNKILSEYHYQQLIRNVRYPKTMYLSKILKILFDNNISIEKLLNIEVSKKIAESTKVKARKLSEAYCLAPWCRNFKKRGKLTKKNVSSHRTSKYLGWYYMTCSECGCEYAIDENNQVFERGYFIKFYEHYKFNSELNNAAFARGADLCEEQVRRSLAYFYSRGITQFPGKIMISIKKSKLVSFVKAIQNKTGLKIIENWSCWANRYEFLVYRYHEDVLKAILENTKYVQSPTPKHSNLERTEGALIKMIDSNVAITIRNVAKYINISRGTLDYWGVNSLVSKYKRMQNICKKDKLQEGFIREIDVLLMQSSISRLTKKLLYGHLGLDNSNVKQVYPMLYKHIDNIVKRQKV